MEPGWISVVTLTSIWWAAPVASVIRASGAPPSLTARALSPQKRRLLLNPVFRHGQVWEGARDEAREAGRQW